MTPNEPHNTSPNPPAARASSAPPDASSVLDPVVSEGLCVGCGICAGVAPAHLTMQVDEFGAYTPAPLTAAPGATDQWGPASLRVCPFGDRDENEDTLAEAAFGAQTGVRRHPEIGTYLASFAAHVSDEDVRMRSSSGGLISWILTDLLRSGEVDGVICVAQTGSRDAQYEYEIIREVEDLERCRKSRYHPVELSRILPQLRDTPGRFAFVGLPCFVKGLHYAMMEAPELKAKIACTVGLFCGHLKTRQFLWYLARCCGVREDEIVSADFRKKVPGYPANTYAFEVTYRRDGRTDVRHVLMRDVYAGSWGLNLFMLDACNCCDDVLAETADISVGDAWLPQYVPDHRGESVVVCRRQALLDRVRDGAARGEIELTELTEDQVTRSQASGLRHRRPGLSYRLHLARQRGQWRPRKRVPPDPRQLTQFQRLVQRVRLRLKDVSKRAYRDTQTKGHSGIDYFVRRMRPWVKLHNGLYFIRAMGGRVARAVGLLRSKSQ